MYILELIMKHLRDKELKKNSVPEEIEQEEDLENCEHIYVPIDSTNDYLACNKCGNVIQNRPVKKNIFKV